MDESELASYVQDYCRQQSSLTDEQVSSEFKRQFHHKSLRRALHPWCIPYSVSGRQITNKVVSPDQILEEINFDFYHHSPQEIIDYSIDIRKHPRIILSDMDGLMLDEFPGVAGKHIYMISSNGHHRSFVFSTLGLKHVLANVQICNGNVWRYYIGRNIHQIRTGRSILRLFLQLGIISACDQDTIDQCEYHISGPYNVAGWILPELKEFITPAQALDESSKRLQYIERIYGEIPLPPLKYIRNSKCRSLLSNRFVITFIGMKK